MNKIMLILFVCVAVTGSAQTSCDCFDRLYELSNHYYFANNWPMAIATLKDAVSFISQESAGEYYNDIAEYYLKDGNVDSAKCYFTKGVQYGYNPKWVQSSYPEIFAKLDSVKIAAYTTSLKSKIDYDVYDRFVQTLAIDQATRDGTLYPEDDIFHGAPAKRAFIDSMMARVDSFDFVFVNWVLDNYQFPSSYNLGFYPSGFMGLLLHITATDNVQSAAILKKLTSLNEKCNFPQKSTILFLRDRKKLYREKKSCCGVIGNNAIRYASIEDVNKVDSIRFLYNQIRLKEEVSRTDSVSLKNKMDLNKRGYVPKPYPSNYFCLKKYHFE